MEPNSCTHWWKIDTPDGSTWLPGSCRKCGETRTFRATLPTKQPIKKKIIEKDEVKSLEELTEEEDKQGDEW